MTTSFTTYRDAGLSVIPIKADGTKSPAVAWAKYQNEPPSLEETRRWESQYEGVAIIGGAVSGNLEIIDVDEPSLSRPFIEALKLGVIPQGAPTSKRMVRHSPRSASSRPTNVILFIELPGFSIAASLIRTANRKSLAMTTVLTVLATSTHSKLGGQTSLSHMDGCKSENTLG